MSCFIINWHLIKEFPSQCELKEKAGDNQWAYRYFVEERETIATSFLGSVLQR